MQKEASCMGCHRESKRISLACSRMNKFGFFSSNWAAKFGIPCLVAACRAANARLCEDGHHYR